jgi:adenosylhomocysteine nucleosidase
VGDVTVLAVCGLKREAKMVARPGVVTLASGGDIATLGARIKAALTPQIKAIISIGVAGALDATLEVGDAVVAAHIAPLPPGGGGTVDQAWADRLAFALPTARRGAIFGSSHMVVDAAAKAQLYRQSAALCVDMESHIAAEAAAAHGLAFAALRFISDDAARALPSAAQAGMKPDGGMDILAVLKSIAADPRQLPALIRTGMEAEAAFRALLRSGRRLGPTLGFADIEGLHLP